MIGSRLGPYEITAKLGEGGMGEVYRATDTKLRRDVAIKVLPAAFTEDKERLARFEREAQLLAQLHHPNIASIFGLEESEGIKALVMELVEGPTLAERLESGPLGLEESLSLGRQIAEALEEAHEKGIIHRDLKPQNIKASIEGKVKVLDFGLAKAMDPTAGSPTSASNLAMSPTLTMGATVQGMILGTAAYMAPEQAAGAQVDRRADIWSFGVVLYEMLSGRRLFDGETVSHVLAGVLKDEPDFSALPEGIPPRILRLLRRCLRKKPRERLQAIGDARLILDEAIAGAKDEPAAGSIPGNVPIRSPSPARWAIAGLALATLGLGARLLLVRPPAPTVVRAEVSPPAGTHFHIEASNPGPVAVSPDGKLLVFAAAREGRRSLWLRAVDSLDPRELPGTEEAQYPFWSPDSRFVGFFTDGNLMKIASAGGPPVRLSAAGQGKGGSWNEKGTIVFAPASTGPLSAVSASGGEPRQLTTLDPKLGDTSHRHPRFLPDGEHFLFVARGSVSGKALRVGSLDGTSPVALPLLASSANFEYAGGRLLFLRDTTLMAQPFDAVKRELSGEAVPLVEHVLYIPGAALGIFSVSRQGVLAHQTGSTQVAQRLVWRDRSGNELGALGEPAGYFQPSIAPDGKRVAVAKFDVDTGTSDIWIFDVERGLGRRLTFDQTMDTNPVWSPDGSTIAFSSRKGGESGAWRQLADGTGKARRIAASGTVELAPSSWSPGSDLIVLEAAGGDSPDLFTVSSAGGEVQPLLMTPFEERSGAISPDGKWLAYTSSDSGRWNVFVTTFPEPGPKWQISPDEGREPIWRRDGRELYFRGRRQLYAAEVSESTNGFVVGAIQPLFDLPSIFASVRQWHAATDGKRFLISEPVGESDASPILLTVNWDTELPKP